MRGHGAGRPFLTSPGVRRPWLGLSGALPRGLVLALGAAAAVCHGAQAAQGTTPAASATASTSASVSQGPAAASIPRIALVVGNAHYASVGPLRNPENDARDMCVSLTQLGFQVQCVVDVPNKREFKSAIRNFTALLSKGTAGLFYYAGHGLQVDGENYLVPTQAELKVRADIDDESLNLKYLMAELDQAGNGFNIVILDACRNNPWSGSFRAVGRGLAATTDTPAGTLVVYATAANDLAQDGSGRNGVFTRSLLSHLPKPGLSIEEMIKHVTIDVQQESFGRTGMRQTPFVYSSFTGDFCFAGCDAPALPAVDAVTQAELQAAKERNAQLEKALADTRASQAAEAQSRQLGAPVAAPAPTPRTPPPLPPTF
jgi:hypothetical protein